MPGGRRPPTALDLRQGTPCGGCLASGACPAGRCILRPATTRAPRGTTTGRPRHVLFSVRADRPLAPASLACLRRPQRHLRQGRDDRRPAGHSASMSCRASASTAPRARALGAPDDVAAASSSSRFFTTLTNVNFTATRFVELIPRGGPGPRPRPGCLTRRPRRAAGWRPKPPPAPPLSCPRDMDGLPAQAAEVGVRADAETVGDGRRRPAGADPLRPQGRLRLCAPCARAGQTTPRSIADGRVMRSTILARRRPTSRAARRGSLALGRVNLRRHGAARCREHRHVRHPDADAPSRAYADEGQGDPRLRP